MSPIEKIKNGILEANWSTVCEGYEQLTGDNIEAPCCEPKRTNAEKIVEEIKKILDNFKTVKNTTATKIEKKSVDEEGHDNSIKLDESLKTPITKEEGGVRFITNEPDPEEMERNKKRAQRTNKVKIKRAPLKKFKVQCTQCQSDFESEINSGEFGQTCKKCLNNTRDRFHNA